MGKQYISSDLINSSRLIKYIEKLSDSDKEIIKGRVEFYIKDNYEYCDKGNYNHLSDILSCLALNDLLISKGMTNDDIVAILKETMEESMVKRRDLFKKLSGKNWFWPLIKKVVPLGFKKGSGYGWEYTWYSDDDKNEFKFDCDKCIYAQIFGKYNVQYLGPCFCNNDIFTYGNLDRTNFIRTKTLCNGGDKCDFKFVRYEKGEEFERNKSI